MLVCVCVWVCMCVYTHTHSFASCAHLCDSSAKVNTWCDINHDLRWHSWAMCFFLRQDQIKSFYFYFYCCCFLSHLLELSLVTGRCSSTKRSQMPLLRKSCWGITDDRALYLGRSASELLSGLSFISKWAIRIVVGPRGYFNLVKLPCKKFNEN